MDISGTSVSTQAVLQLQPSTASRRPYPDCETLRDGKKHLLKVSRRVQGSCGALSGDSYAEPKCQQYVKHERPSSCLASTNNEALDLKVNPGMTTVCGNFKLAIDTTRTYDDELQSRAFHDQLGGYEGTYY